MRSTIRAGWFALLLLAVAFPAAAQGSYPSAAPTSPSAAPTAPTPSGVAPTAAEVVREEDCEDAEGFTCVTLRMPLDHFSDTGRTIEVTYAFRPRERRTARGDRSRKLGTFVTLTGGPGSSGIASAASYTDSYDQAIDGRSSFEGVDVDVGGGAP